MAIEEDITPLARGDTESIPAMRMSEAGYNGLTVLGGDIFEECNYELRWPWCIKTYKKMLKDGTIYPAVDYVQNIMSNVEWNVVAPKGYEEDLKAEIAFLKTVMNDMSHSWLSFIKQAASFVPYGFAAFEIVPRYRLKEKGSRYNDGLVGIKKLALRSQDTIVGWKYKNKGRDLSHIVQRVNIPQSYNATTYYSNQDNGATDVAIPMSKVLLFRNNPLKDSPIGTSPLIGVWEAWKYKKAYEESQAHGVAQDVHGFKVLYIPPQYMREDATEQDKAIYAYYQKIMRNIHIGKESGLILPQILDDQGEQFFKFEVISLTGQKAFDVEKIISRYQQEILTALYADFLTLGQGGGGSFALSDSKMQMVKLMVESKLKEIQDVLNHKLIPKLFELNGWDVEVYPAFEFGEVFKVTLAEFAKALQQASATGNVLKTPININYIQSRLGLPDTVEEDMDQEELYSKLSDTTSRSGDGAKAGAGNGTSTKPAGQDNSASNTSNK